MGGPNPYQMQAMNQMRFGVRPGFGQQNFEGGGFQQRPSMGFRPQFQQQQFQQQQFQQNNRQGKES